MRWMTPALEHKVVMRLEGAKSPPPAALDAPLDDLGSGKN